MERRIANDRHLTNNPVRTSRFRRWGIVCPVLARLARIVTCPAPQAQHLLVNGVDREVKPVVVVNASLPLPLHSTAGSNAMPAQA